VQAALLQQALKADPQAAKLGGEAEPVFELAVMTALDAGPGLLSLGGRSAIEAEALVAPLSSRGTALASAPGARVTIGGVQATELAGRLSPAQMAALQQTHGTEFALIYLT